MTINLVDVVARLIDAYRPQWDAGAREEALTQIVEAVEAAPTDRFAKIEALEAAWKKVKDRA